VFFFFLPVGVNYRAERWPVVTFALIVLCTIIHIWSMALSFHSDDAYEWWINTFWFIPAQFSWFTVFTSMFVHGGIFHFVGNMIYLFLFGASTEDRIGRGRFLGLYLVGGVAAAFAHVAMTGSHFDSETPLGGASGAISAAMGAFLLLFPKTKIDFKYFGLFFFRPFGGEFSLKAWIVMSFWFLSDLFWAVLGMMDGEDGGGTAFGAHVGGFVLGMAALGMLKLWWRGHPPEASLEQETPMRASRTVAVRKILHATAERPFLIYQHDQEHGPYTFDEVLQYKEQGFIAADALFWRQGMPEWRPVEEVSGPALKEN
jgi:membrane associated rhomboid family serine protease